MAPHSSLKEMSLRTCVYYGNNKEPAAPLSTTTKVKHRLCLPAFLVDACARSGDMLTFLCMGESGRGQGSGLRGRVEAFLNARTFTGNN